MTDLLLTVHVQCASVDRWQAALPVMEWSARVGRPFGLLLASANTFNPNGDGVVGQIRQDPALAATPIVLIGARESDRERCREMGLAGYLRAPVGQSDLLEILVKLKPSSHAPEAAPTTEDSPGWPPEATIPPQARKVLLVEDVLENRLLVTKLLEQRGYLVQPASNGRQAVETFRRESFDLVLMDIQMPEMGGMEAVAAIREQEEVSGRHTPIIALTAHAMQGDRERYLEAGMDGYVSKPIRRAELFEAIQDLLGAPVSHETGGMRVS